MANEVLLKSGDQYVFADHVTDFSTTPATAANNLTFASNTQVDFDLTGVAASGGARASDKMALPNPWGRYWSLDACLEFETAPTDGGTVHFYWGASPAAAAATGNPGGLTGTDAAVTDTTGILGQLLQIGSMTVRNNVINIGHVGVFMPVYLQGILVVVNQASTALRSTATAMDETHIVLTEIIDEIQ